MTDRTDGYVTDVGYTHGYYPELNPLRMRLALLHAGFRVPNIATACELGFGQGLSINIHAAASPVHWYGTDFNAAHAGFARQLAAASGADIGLFDESFEDFARRPDLPAFDFIALHGVWSWISDRNRTLIVDFVRRRLKAGGVLYLGYNALPGWAAFSSVRHLMVEHANRAGTEGRGTAARIDEAIRFAEKLLATDPEYARRNPQVLERFEVLLEEDRRYLAHEYFNRDWAPMHFETVARWLEPAAVRYACSATFNDHVDFLSLTDRQRGLLGEVHDPGLRESVRDFIINRTFRHDYWVKGARMLSEPARAEALRRERVISVVPRLDLPFKVRAALALNKTGPGEAVYAPILERLADRRAVSLGELEQAVKHKGISLTQVLDTVMLIASCDHIVAAQDDAVMAAARPRTDKLNAHLIERARFGGDITDIASPVTGGGIHIERLEQLFLAAFQQGGTRPDDWVREASKVIAAEGTLEGPAVDLAKRAQTFAEQTLPTLRTLRIA